MQLLNWPKVYIPMVCRFVLMSLGNIPFKKIFLTVLFDTLTNNVSFSPIVYLYYCYCTFIYLYVGF
jgi:hypothetical protein